MIALVLLVAVFAILLFSPAVRRLGVDLRFWVAAYSLYLLAVFFPQSSTFRLLMPLFPLLGAIAHAAQPRYRVGDGRAGRGRASRLDRDLLGCRRPRLDAAVIRRR